MDLKQNKRGTFLRIQERKESSLSHQNTGKIWIMTQQDSEGNKKGFKKGVLVQNLKFVNRSRDVDRKNQYVFSTVLGLFLYGTREGNGKPLQYSCLENPMDGGAWWAAVHRVARSWTRLSDFTFTFHFHALEKEMATHSSVLAWRIPGTGKPGGLLSMGLHRVGHD